jgi:hypothetical protein
MRTPHAVVTGTHISRASNSVTLKDTFNKRAAKIGTMLSGIRISINTNRHTLDKIRIYVCDTLGSGSNVAENSDPQRCDAVTLRGWGVIAEVFKRHNPSILSEAV